MQPRRAFRPDLQDCLLEDRLSPVVSNLGVIVLTTGGFYLLIPFPGPFAAPSTISSNTAPSAAPSVNGTPIDTPFFMMGLGGISSVQPGNITGFPASAPVGSAGSGRGATIVMTVGSGADEAGGPSIPPVSRNTVANDTLNPAPLIGGRASGDVSPVLPAGQSYRSTAPATTPGVQTTIAPPPATPGPSTPPPPYPPSVVPLIFPFKPATGSTTTAPGPGPGNPAPTAPVSPPGSRPVGPGGDDWG